MQFLRPADERGHTQTSWLDSYHTFSFGEYYDPAYMGYGDLRVINDDTVAPGGGFDAHPHANMEIISIVLSGALEHRDNLGSGSIIRPGEIQKMTAGSGIRHSEFNPSHVDPVHFLQVWILPDTPDLKPSYEQKTFSPDKMHNKLCLIASPDGFGESLKIHQDVLIYQSHLDQDKTITYEVQKDRAIWIQIAASSIAVNDQPLVSGDGWAVWDENMTLSIRGIAPQSNFILFDLKKE